MKSVIPILALSLMSAVCNAEYGTWGTPTSASLILNKGLKVQGNFGNPNSCERANTIFVSTGHPQYDQIYSMVMTAFASGRRLRFEVRKCAVVGWIATQSIGILDASAMGEVAIGN